MFEMSFAQTGRWVKMNPPSIEEHLNHFVKVGKANRAYGVFAGMSHLFLMTSAPTFYSWGEDVKSPVSGEVIELQNSKPDKQYFNLFLDIFKWFAQTKAPRNERLGNYVIIKDEKSREIIISQLQEASLSLKVGDKVEQGQNIAKIGSSGLVTQPCLGLSVKSDFGGGLDRVLFKKYWLRTSKSWDLKTYESIQQSQVFSIEEPVKS